MRTVYPPAAIGFSVPGVFIVINQGWTTALLALAISIVLIAVLLGARGWRLANRHVDQIFDDELS